MTLTIYNSFARKREAFVPADPNCVTMYVCGPTVYNDPHIGNARPAVVFDILFRLLQRLYPVVRYARNITDVEDKINDKARAEGVPIDTITNRYIEVYRADMAALGVLPPTIEPRVTETMPELIAMIGRLVESGNAYEVDGHVLFHVGSFADYGSLSNRSRDEMIAGARVEVAPYKKDPADFVLWKPSTDDMPGWDSPWGRGRPGWHIECSAMAETHLGRTIDIHAGGQDLIFPHHENEIAQSTCAHGGETFARYWMHNAMLRVDGTKMSKSIGNVLLISALRAEWPGEVIRWLLISGHYRHPLDFAAAGLEQAQKTLDRLYGLLRDTADAAGGVPADDDPDVAAVVQALSEDLNTPKALAEVFRIAKALEAAEGAERQRLRAALLDGAGLLGLLQREPADWFAAKQAASGIDAAEVEALIAERQAARKGRDFARADAIRDDLAARGVVLEDSAAGTTWRIETPSTEAAGAGGA
ncbi:MULTISPECIES: cysteine--tRNA ligase [unclassified Minwuia]|jgi:cysteinyl-tRNA synthetase|uniref:cysteine--tRNA ligase n=1 Tax=unclassified Minwuia TaxID=2618799 RepID=UPI002479915A|nr:MULTISPECIES: cysteine--tRNA ligase [unclassified Minwuia]